MRTSRVQVKENNPIKIIMRKLKRRRQKKSSKRQNLLQCRLKKRRQEQRKMRKIQALWHKSSIPFST
jgi:hypothetical protein